MTDETMPREIWATKDADACIVPQIWDEKQIWRNENCTKYIHRTTHEAALQALKQCENVLMSDYRCTCGTGYKRDSLNCRRCNETSKALEQINAILGGGE